jgi:hypothetical protein
MKISAAVIAHAQVWTFTIALTCFLGLLFVLVILRPDLTPTIEKIVASMLTVLGTLLASMSAYFFSRQRPDSTKETP